LLNMNAELRFSGRANLSRLYFHRHPKDVPRRMVRGQEPGQNATAPNTCGLARSKHAVAQSKCAVAVRSMHAAAQSNRAAAATQNTHAEARRYKDALKMRPADCMRHPGLRKAAGWYCSEARPAS
jgi:hypothetical protein